VDIKINHSNFYNQQKVKKVTHWPSSAPKILVKTFRNTSLNDSWLNHQSQYSATVFAQSFQQKMASVTPA